MLHYFVYVLVILLVYYLIKHVIISTSTYDDYKVMEDMFTDKELDFFRKCTDKTEDINTPCFATFQRTLLEKIKTRLGTDLYVHHARFSNNTNKDAVVFHRDIKPKPFYNSPYPKVYTLICYLDDSVFNLGNRVIHAKAGTIILFNAFCLHRGGDVDILNTRNRRVLQWFEVCFTKDDYEEILKRITFIPSVEGTPILRNVIHYLTDFRYLAEATNMMQLFYGMDKTDFIVVLSKRFYVGKIDDIDYYRDF